MIAILSLLLILAVSIVATRIATVALTHTGLSKESARFQARSAFTGVGFTTTEAETIVRHPIRRRIVMLLMLLGNAGLVSAVASLLIGFVGSTEGAFSWLERFLLLLGGIVVLWLLTLSSLIDRAMSRVIGRALSRFTDIDTRDYAGLLQLEGDYAVTELEVRPGDWLADRTLSELALRDEGVVVLGVQRADKTYVGAPNGDCPIYAGDLLILYGRHQAIARVDERRRDARAEDDHDRAVAEQTSVQKTEVSRDPARHTDQNASAG